MFSWHLSDFLFCTVFSGALVLALFMTDAIQAQIDTTASSEAAFYNINCVFTGIFTLELCANLYGHWLREFAADPWVSLAGQTASITCQKMYPPWEGAGFVVCSMMPSVSSFL